MTGIAPISPAGKYTPPSYDDLAEVWNLPGDKEIKQNSKLYAQHNDTVDFSSCKNIELDKNAGKYIPPSYEVFVEAGKAVPEEQAKLLACNPDGDAFLKEAAKKADESKTGIKATAKAFMAFIKAHKVATAIVSAVLLAGGAFGVKNAVDAKKAEGPKIQAHQA